MNIFDEMDNTGQENEDDVVVKLEDLRQAVIWGTDWTTDTIVNQMNKGNIDLDPKFQRREAWTGPRKSRFIESLILGLPIPQIILAERKEKKGTYIVIDGKQRLISIRQFFSQVNDNEFPRLKLSSLDSLAILNNLSFVDLDDSPDLEDFATAIENQSIRTIVIKNWPNEEFLYNVFLRLNTGSLPLAPQELRQALHPGKFIDFTDDFSVESEQIKRILNIKKPDYRMRDVELVIRYFAFKYYAEDYTGNLKKFFDTTVQILNNSWSVNRDQIQADAQELNNAIDFTYEIWGDNAFRKWKDGSYQGRFNRAVFDIMVYYFSNLSTREALREHGETIRQRFVELCVHDVEFLNSFETSTKNLQPTHKRYSEWGNALDQITEFTINIPKFNQ
ncbi:DUF262 domain-containing protein [Algoriphagus sp. NG3]|uniref:DUF262 domain-containing protein n=1 Tax=Algoriphagus sp. NG3 TaxID=3097546 RepID=UPI002A8314B5|nr:DUF262 domain-containing protein [Algoriphagus sp. NG3]WPR77702.1 DUF262 domain-containing protein [Algoriphagus sp. NG3]